jgi:hypothetical protein
MQRRHAHQHVHARDKDAVTIQEHHIVEEKRAVGDIVTATIDGQVVSWTNEYAGPSAVPTPVAGAGSPAVQMAAPASSYVALSAQPSINAGSGNWGRQAYYNATSQTASGLVFLNHMGGQGSGVFD